MDRIVAESETFKAKDEILQSIVGVGPQVSRTLLVHLPELGTGTRQSIAALVGLAPFADDSGTCQPHPPHPRRSWQGPHRACTRRRSPPSVTARP